VNTKKKKERNTQNRSNITKVGGVRSEKSGPTAIKLTHRGQLKLSETTWDCLNSWEAKIFKQRTKNRNNLENTFNCNEPRSVTHPLKKKRFGTSGSVLCDARRSLAGWWAVSWYVTVRENVQVNEAFRSNNIIQIRFSDDNQSITEISNFLTRNKLSLCKHWKRHKKNRVQRKKLVSTCYIRSNGEVGPTVQNPCRRYH
jgi:hypothetical protein